jgi:hypothetical protein
MIIGRWIRLDQKGVYSRLYLKRIREADRVRRERSALIFDSTPKGRCFLE